MIFDLYKQGPICASTAGDRGSVPVTLCSYMYWYPSTGFLIKAVFFKWQVVPCNGIRIPESVKFLLVESGILGYGIWNTSKGIRDPTKDWNPESKFHWQRLESRTWNPKSTPWNPESKTALACPYMGLDREAGSRHGTTTHKKLNFYSKPAQTIQGYRLYFLNPLNIDIKIEILIYCRYTFSIEVLGRICWNIN